MKLAYKTAEMRTPQGLPKVWYCAHPCDHAKYLEALSADILNAASCAVWYDEEPLGEYDPEELCETIKAMNLIVIPVTDALISESNRAADTELSLAIENRIPILPVLVEDGIEEKFNQRFGDLQLLLRADTDGYSISYREKLLQFLSKTLTDAELIDKIRAAFDAYIFLSYRKKDRKYARELMELIHKNDFCRDVAIWYDEFLLPGENFNDSIKKAIEASRLFVLNVTPGILEKTVDRDGNECDNYVLAIEYPLALERKKTVLPAESVPTDRVILADKYKGLPPCVSTQDQSSLSQSLTCAFDDIALRQNDKDPQHNFFIGLAYLNGIDVEKNHALALSLIESAANDGLTQALEKLVCMYQNGEGVARDAVLEEDWRRRLIRHREEQFNRSHDAWDAHLWLCEILYLTNLLIKAKKHEAARDECEHAYSLAIRFCEEFDSPLAKKDLSSSLYTLGLISEISGNVQMATELYIRSNEITEDFTKKSSSFLVKKDHARDTVALGRLFESENEYDRARECYQKAYRILSEACKGNDHGFLRWDLAYTCERLGYLGLQTDSISLAKEYFIKARDLYRDNTYIAKNEAATRKMASVLIELGNISRLDGDLSSARCSYLEAIEAYKNMSDISSSDLENFALAYCKLASVCDGNEALSALKCALPIYKRLHEEYPDDPFFKECVDDLTEVL